ncbi:hypothetical protein JW992_09105 [candidate division KSB1 bacterium]|nr:hypothetical protein [candidate division KSB1 bacterium]
MKSAGPILLSLILACSDPPSVVGLAQKEMHSRQSAENVRVIQVQNSVGSIAIHGTSSTEIHMQAQISVQASSRKRAQTTLENVRIQSETKTDTLVISTVIQEYRGDTPLSFLFRRPQSRVKIEYDLIVPADRNLFIATVQGSIHLDNIGGSAEAQTLQGSIEAERMQGAVNFNCGEGDIRVQFDALPPASHSTIANTIGNLELEWRPTETLQLEATINDGRLHSWVPLTSEVKEGISNYRGKFGDGEPAFLSIETQGGRVYLNQKAP